MLVTKLEDLSDKEMFLMVLGLDEAVALFKLIMSYLSRKLVSDEIRVYKSGYILSRSIVPVWIFEAFAK